MPISTLKGSVVTAKLWLPVEETESSALDQLRNIASLPWVAHVSVMPDCHYGRGATVGSVIGMRGAVSPAAVGVDIGCGMGAVLTNLKASQLPTDLKAIRSRIEAEIPVGFNGHESMVKPYRSLDGMKLKNDIAQLFSEFKDLDSYVSKLEAKAGQQLGTLGGGNHFIELCLDTGRGNCESCQGNGSWEQDAFNGDHYTYTVTCDACQGSGTGEPRVWMMLHSGSRNIGKTLAEVHMWKAKELEHNIKLPDRDLAVFLAGTPEMQAYRRDLFWAQRYAMLNRRVMFELYKGVMLEFFPEIKFEWTVLCHHNYVAEEKHFGEELMVTRKGAISARKGEYGVIPGSMGAKSFIVRGLGNPESLCSASHGAGRKMSRGAAKRHFTEADLIEQTKGVECRKDASVIDEIPGAYKDIEQVMKNQADLVEVVAELRQVLCVKG